MTANGNGNQLADRAPEVAVTVAMEHLIRRLMRAELELATALGNLANREQQLSELRGQLAGAASVPVDSVADDG